MEKPLIHELSSKYPLATANFFAWIKAKNDVRSYISYLRRPVDELPVELLVGVMLLFFSDNGITVSLIGTRKGRYHSATNRKRKTTGLYYKERVERYPKEVDQAMELCITNAFSVLEKELKRKKAVVISDPTDVIVGLDIEAITQQRAS